MRVTPAELKKALRVLGADQVFATEDQRPVAQAVAFLRHFGRDDLASLVSALMESARAAEEREMRAIVSARREKTTPKKHKAYANIMLENKPRVLSRGSSRVSNHFLWFLYKEVLDRGSELDPWLPADPTPQDALSYVGEFVGYKHTSTLRLRLLTERKRVGEARIPIPGRSEKVQSLSAPAGSTTR